MSLGATSNEPVTPSGGSGAPAVGLSEMATPGPERKNAVKRQVPGASGAKWTRKLRPEVAPVSAALPSAAKNPGTTYDFTPLVNATVSR